MASRRDFLTAFRKPLHVSSQRGELVVRPPYGLFESLFQSECPTCQSKACVASCEEKIILIRGDGTPMLNFTQSGCTFCEDCAKVCQREGMGVLSVEDHQTEKINATFRISTDTCIAHHGVICFSCKEPCIDDAILFNGMFNPVIDMDQCTGCGFCVARCPTKAIGYVATPLAPSTEDGE